MKVVEMFTGIGAQAKALNRVANRKLNIEIVNTSEWNIHAIVAYQLIHNGNSIRKDVDIMSKEQLLDTLIQYPLSLNGIDLINNKYLKSLNIELLKLIYNSILENNNLLDIKKIRGSDIANDIDLLTYSFPCQDLSTVGSLHGYKHGIDRDKNTRSGLLWEVERILIEKNEMGLPLPKFLLLENVTALEAKRHKGNFELWQNKLNDLGYINKVYKLNAEDFGIPQYRKRVLMLSVWVGNNKDNKKIIKEYWEKNNLNDKEYINKLGITKKGLKNFLKINYKNPILYEEALSAQPQNTPSRIKIWEKNNKIINENNVIGKKVQTITTKQDRHPNSGNIYFDVNNDKAKFRFLTPRECFLLMGFDEKDFNILINNNFITRGSSKFFSRDILYKLAGNSIVVNVLENVFDQMIDINSLI